MFNPDTAPYINSFLTPSFQTAAEALKIAPSVAPGVATLRSKRL